MTDNKLKKRLLNLDQTVEYFRKRISAGTALSEELLKTIDFKNGTHQWI